MVLRGGSPRRVEAGKVGGVVSPRGVPSEGEWHFSCCRKCGRALPPAQLSMLQGGVQIRNDIFLECAHLGKTRSLEGLLQLVRGECRGHWRVATNVSFQKVQLRPKEVCATSFGPSMGSWKSVDHKLSKIIEEVVSEFEDELRNTCRKCRVTSVGFGGKSRCVLRAAGASAPGSRSEPLRREVGAVAPGGRRHCCGWQGRCARRVVGAAALGGRQGPLHRAARAAVQERQEPPSCQVEGAGRRRRCSGRAGWQEQPDDRAARPAHQRHHFWALLRDGYGNRR